MKPIFAKAPSLGMRLIIAVIFSIMLIISDGRSSLMIQARNLLENRGKWIILFC